MYKRIRGCVKVTNSVISMVETAINIDSSASAELEKLKIDVYQLNYIFLDEKSVEQDLDSLMNSLIKSKEKGLAAQLRRYQENAKRKLSALSALSEMCYVLDDNQFIYHNLEQIRELLLTPESGDNTAETEDTNSKMMVPAGLVGSQDVGNVKSKALKPSGKNYVGRCFSKVRHESEYAWAIEQLKEKGYLEKSINWLEDGHDPEKKCPMEIFKAVEKYQNDHPEHKFTDFGNEDKSDGVIGYRTIAHMIQNKSNKRVAKNG